MFGKIEITGTIELKTGMHIDTSESFSAIGAIDSPVAKDSISKLPYIPGSSLKGKMRSLLRKLYSDGRLISTHNDDVKRLTRLFGRAGSTIKHSRIIFSDSIMCNRDELISLGAESETEAKEENSLNPLTAASSPRQIERVIRGAKFPLNIIYNIENEEELYEDMQTIAAGLKLLEYDYIGGHGSRGYGKLKINDISVKAAVGAIDDDVLARCGEIIKAGI